MNEYLFTVYLVFLINEKGNKNIRNNNLLLGGKSTTSAQNTQYTYSANWAMVTAASSTHFRVYLGNANIKNLGGT